MSKYDLSVIITARNEEFLSRTVEGVLEAREGRTEVIVIADGGWPSPPVKDHPNVTMIYHREPVGQRKAINEAARLSKAKYIMKLDAHCIMDQGFDVKLMKDCEPNWTVVPRLYNLHAFDWRCKKCGNRWYQGPTPTKCQLPGEGKGDNPDCDSQEFERVMVWKPRMNRRSDFMGFDRDLKFQYWGSLGNREGQDGQIADTMSLLGACFFMEREWYWKIGGSSEELGIWGQQGTEISCKTWLSGGRLVVNKNTWYSHMFRTQGGDFGFPYKLSGKQTTHARNLSRKMFRDGAWDGMKYPLSWLVEKFWPVKNWKQEDLDELKRSEKKRKSNKGIIYYTDNQLNLKIAHAVQGRLRKIGLPIVSASLKPMSFGDKNIVLNEERGYLAMFRQILAALKASEAEVVYFCEHDVLYHPSHFKFTPEDKDIWYYNTNVWKVNKENGNAVRVDDCKQTSGIVVYRETALKHYQKRLEILENVVDKIQKGEDISLDGYIRKQGFEPGTHGRAEKVDDSKAEGYESEYPNIDIRHSGNLTASRWSKDQFRNQKYTKGWKESHLSEIPGWSDLQTAV